VVWSVLALGFGFGLLPRSRPPKLARIPLWPSACWRSGPRSSSAGRRARSRRLPELARYLHYIGLFVLIWSVIDARTWRARPRGSPLPRCS